MHDHKDHSFKNHSPPHAPKNIKRQEFRLYVIFFAVSLLVGVTEIVVQRFMSHSVSLFGDGTHGINDGFSYGILAFVTAKIMCSPEQERYWTQKGVWTSFWLLAFGDALVFWQAIDRFLSPHEVLSWWTFYTTAACLFFNAFVVLTLYLLPKAKRNIRHDSVLFHALSDMWVSIGVLVSAVIIISTNWYSADWIMAFVIAFYLLFLLFKMLKRILNEDWEIGHNHNHNHEHHH
jgi:cobalt-zinc-cadmium efflux system protein